MLAWTNLVALAALMLGCTRDDNPARHAVPPTPAPAPTPPPGPTPAVVAPDAAAPDAALPPSPFDGIALRAGMPREEAERVIATALHEQSTYNVYGGNLRGGTVTYSSGAFALDVRYKAGMPAPWVVGSNGVAEHYPPVDESVETFRAYRK